MALTRRTLLKWGAAASLLGGSGWLDALSAQTGDAKTGSDLMLWYRSPARGYLDALPLGNGRLGAMVYGGTDLERISVNEDTLWSGGPYDPAQDVDPSVLTQIRDLSFSGKLHDAQNLANKLQGNPKMQAAYQTVGEIQLTFPGHKNATDYRRELDLNTAIAKVTYSVDGVRYTREVFCTPVDQVMVIRLSADQPGKLNFSGTFVTPMPDSKTDVMGTDTVTLSGKNGDSTTRDGKTLLVASALTYHARFRVLAEGGQTTAQNGAVTVANADSATLLLAAATSYKKYDDVTGDPVAACADSLKAVDGKAYDGMRMAHVTEHQRLFQRVSFNLAGAIDGTSQSTDERLRNFGKQNDPAFSALNFQYGRYLLLAASRPGGQPANLQGIWNDKLTAAWDGKYTININTEMNYWPSQVANLSECEEPLFRLVTDLAETGARTAKATYHMKGWVCHHNTDLWRASAPIDGAFWGQWPMGGAWLCNQLYQRYEFDGDKEYLAKLYPLMKGAAEFFHDFLVEDPANHWLVTCPSMSPEHEYQHGLTSSPGPTMDMQILRELFANCMNASEVLGMDEDFRKECADKRARLAPNQVGSAGQLQEWIDDVDTTAPEIEHRHMSPLYGLYPGSEITPADPKIFEGARKLAQMRGSQSRGMGWAMAWRIALWARLLDGETAHSELADVITTKTETNLFDGPSIQLDGSFGRTAGMAEMLLQSHTGVIQLLPALPSAWPEGKVTGLRARGGFEVDIAWQGGKLTEATLRSKMGQPGKLKYAGKMVDVTIPAGGNMRVGPDLNS